MMTKSILATAEVFHDTNRKLCYNSLSKGERKESADAAFPSQAERYRMVSAFPVELW
jgi:hypothetical protein